MTALLVSVLLTSFAPVEKIVAVVGSNPILHSDVEEALVQLGLNPSGSYTVDSESSDYHDVLEELIENQLILNAAVSSGFYPTDEEIQDLLEAELRANPTEQDSDTETLSEALAEYQASQTFIGRKMQAALQDLPMNSETYLLSNADLVEDLIMPRHIGWIYFPVLPSGPDYDEAMDEMVQLKARIDSGESFEELAMEYSDDSSARNGGYLGTFGPGEMTFIFEDAAYSLELDEISDPVVTTYGIHIIRLDGRNSDGTIEASHILRMVPVDSIDVEKTIEDANSVLFSIRSGQLSFEDAARLYSRDRSSAEDGGDMGMIPLRLWLYQVAEAAQDLEIGTCSEPIVIESTGAVAIIKLYEDTGEINWESYTQDELNGLVQQVVYQDTYNSVVDSLRTEIPVIYYLENTI